MSHHTSAALPAVDGNLALRTEPCSLVLIEGGLSQRRAAQRPRRSELTPAQGVRLLGCALAVVLAVVLCSALSDALRAGRAMEALDALPTESAVVSSGDTLWSIAERSCDDLPVRDVVSWIQERNGIDGGLVVPGQRLVVPTTSLG